MSANAKFILRHYWDKEMKHMPYQNMVHNLKDKEVFQMSELENLLKAANVEDGDEFEITIRRTGRRPFPNLVWKWVSDHTYARRRVQKQ
jgi:hypothetical protein